MYSEIVSEPLTKKEPKLIPKPAEKEPTPRWVYPAVALAILTFLFVLNRIAGCGQPVPTPTLAPTYTFAPTYTLIAAAPTYTPRPTDNPTPAPTTPVPTPVPTTPVPTPIPTTPVPPTSVPPTPVPPTPIPILVPLPFEDNFDSGIKPDWEQLKGTWRMVTSALVPDHSPYAAYSVIVVGDPRWTNYAVDVDVSHTAFDSQFLRLVVRAQNVGNYVAMGVGCRGTDAILVFNGKEQTIGHSDTDGIDWNDYHEWKNDHLRMEVRGSTYSLISNGMTLVTVQDSTFSAGRAGLAVSWFNPSDIRLDNFRVTPLN